jgi:CBS domain-containing protein
MTYILFGPGIRSAVTINELVLRSDLPPVTEIRPVDDVSHIAYEGERVQGEAQPRHQQALQTYQEHEEKKSRTEERRPAVRAGQIMSEHVSTITESTPVEMVWSMFETRGIHHLPVISDQTQKMSGILSDHDYLIKVHMAGRADEAELQAVDIMTDQVLAASEDTEIRELARVMFEHKIGAVPIVNNDDKLIGIVTRGDILKTLINEEPLELWI